MSADVARPLAATGMETIALFHLLFFISGFAGLLYEVVWARQLSTVFGVSAFALTAVLSAYFLGMAIGAFALGRIADRLARPLRAYGLTELALSGIAAGVTLALPHLDRWVLPALMALEGHFLLQSLARFGGALLALAAPTILLGATLPMLVRGLVLAEASLGRGVAGLYAANTAGAVGGVLVAGFALIPAIGLERTAFVGALLGAGVGAVAIALAREVPAMTAPAARASAGPMSGDRVVLLALLLSGFGAIGLEVVLTRILIQYVASITQVFTVILATFLAGIALGSALCGRLVDRARGSSVTWLALAESGVGFAAVISVWALAVFAPLLAAGSGALAGPGADPSSRFTHFTWLASAVAFAPPTLLLGATFPLAARAYAGIDASLGTRIGGLYAANTTGGVLGSFVAGFVLIPHFGSARSFQLLVLVFAATGALLALRGRALTRSGRVVGVLASAAAAALALALPPDFASEVTARRVGAERVVRMKEDYYGMIAVLERREGGSSFRQLMINGDFMSNTSAYAQRYMRLAAHLPALLASEPPRSGLVICFGVGITADALARYPSLERLTVVELSREVVESAPYFVDANRGVLNRPGVEVVVADGRNFLATHPDARFDVITLEPPPPPSAGVANLYSREFYRLARQHLAPGGTMAQWIPVLTQAPETTRSLIRAFTGEFPYVSLWWTASVETLLVGSDRPLALDAGRLAAALATQGLDQELRSIGVTDPLDVAADYLLGDAELRRLADGAEPMTDDHPIVEYRPTGQLDGNRRALESMLALRPPAAEIARRFGLARDQMPALEARMRRRIGERLQIRATPAAAASR